MNLMYLGNSPDLTFHIHPSYQTFRHTNPIIYSLKKNLNDKDFNSVVNEYRRSAFTKEALIEDYLRGEIPSHPLVKDHHYYKALDRTTVLFSPPQKYRPVSFPDLRYYPWKLSSSAEAPYTHNKYFTDLVNARVDKGLSSSRSITFHNLYNDIFIHNREKIHRIKDGIYVDRFGNDLRYWNYAHARSHLVKATDPDKIRMVFGTPKLLLMAECMFLWPLIRHLLDSDNPMLWGFETLKGGWYATYNWFANYHPRAQTFLAFDWKQFDKHLQFELIDDIHDKFKSYIDFNHGYIPTYNYPDTFTNPNRLLSLWNWTCDAIKHTPDTLPNGDQYIRQHAGLGSGLFQTQILGSFANCVILLTTLSSLGFNIDTLGVKVQGDDSIIGLNEIVPPMVYDSFKQTFAHEAKRRFGMILNESKSMIGSSLEGLPLLGFTNIGSIPFRHQNELLASLLYPERRSDENRLMARTIGIAYANCGAHHTVFKICDEIYSFLEQRGFSPDLAGLPDFIRGGQLPYTSDNDLKTFNRFPTYFETISSLTNVPQRTEKDRDRYWPKSIFLSTY